MQPVALGRVGGERRCRGRVGRSSGGYQRASLRQSRWCITSHARCPTRACREPCCNGPAERRGGSGYRRSRRATRRTLGGVVGRPSADAAASFAPAELRLHDARSGATRVGFRSVERAGGGGGDADGGIWFGGRAVCRTRRQRATDAALRRAGGGRGEHSSHLTRNARTSKREGGWLAAVALCRSSWIASCTRSPLDRTDRSSSRRERC
mmetsp:Transcript_34260/g.77642  ORF Transcript_34260/g.77642 Transcript_34260/m.77642 type:complete len:209 (-) Transcript_34260:609-1235(-)